MFIIRNCQKLLFISLLLTPGLSVAASEQTDGDPLFKKNCSLCHAIDKKKLGPAVKAMSKEEEVLRQIITEGKNSMPGFKDKLTGEEIDALVSYLLVNQ